MVRRRLEALREAMKRLRLTALLVTAGVNVRYLTGFSGSHGLCLITLTDQFLLTDGRYKDQAPLEVRDCSIVVAKESLLNALAERKLIPARARIGFESQHISLAEFENLRTLMPGRQFVPTISIVEDLAAVKDSEELESIRTAVRITDRVFLKVLSSVRSGIRECDLAAEISYWHRKYGAEGDAFEPIVASGARGALPHARASSNRIKRGEVIVLDMGCRFRGYNSDLTRTVAVGEPPGELKKAYQIVYDAQRKAIAAVRQGQPARRIDNVARTHIRKSGYGRYFTHSLGHGLGIDVHEPLRLSSRSTAVLRTGNVVTIEPGIYIPGVGGVRVEDVIVVTDNGCEVLTTSPKQLRP
jgi:Xaa-Pro aminopeptidase